MKTIFLLGNDVLLLISPDLFLTGTHKKSEDWTNCPSKLGLQIS